MIKTDKEKIGKKIEDFLDTEFESRGYVWNINDDDSVFIFVTPTYDKSER